ncbi:MAG TPA: hypothetical protein VLA67_10160, partial [Nitrospiraceae bacterium]|nr:hypothetical protein [Nitrospiraceae bacterium]
AREDLYVLQMSEPGGLTVWWHSEPPTTSSGVMGTFYFLVFEMKFWSGYDSLSMGASSRDGEMHVLTGPGKRAYSERLN